MQLAVDVHHSFPELKFPKGIQMIWNENQCPCVSSYPGLTRQKKKKKKKKKEQSKKA